MQDDKYKIQITDDPDLFYNRRVKRKGNGNVRIIHAPSPKLKKFQREFADFLCERFKDRFNNNPQVTGFLPGKSIADNARPHLDKDWVVTMDIKDFFPSTSDHLIERIMNEIRDNKAWWLKLFSKKTVYKGKTPYEMVQLITLDKKLTQGSPSSPVLANLAAIDQIDSVIDYAIKRIPEEYGGIDNLSYTRYADDITISFNG